MKELEALRLGPNMYADELQGHTVRLWEDNQAVVFIIRNRTSRSLALLLRFSHTHSFVGTWHRSPHECRFCSPSISG